MEALFLGNEIFFVIIHLQLLFIHTNQHILWLENKLKILINTISKILSFNINKLMSSVNLWRYAALNEIAHQSPPDY